MRHSGGMYRGMYPGRRFKSDLEKSFLNIDNIDNSLLFYHFSDYWRAFDNSSSSTFIIDITVHVGFDNNSGITNVYR